MKREIDDLLEAALAPMELPRQELNDQILRKVKERQHMHYKRRIPAAALVAACTIALCSTTVFAVYKYLTPAEVATEANDNTLQKAFMSEDAILVNETQESGGYRITLMGSVAGKNISNFLSTDGNGEVEDDRIYTVVAIERADGTPMPDTSSDEYGKEDFYVSHYIRGLNPAQYSLMSMGGGYTALVRDGVQYRILDMQNIEMFADKGIYVGVCSGTFYDNGAYLYDESTGEMRRNEDYAGVNALFKLPVDPSKADPAAAAAYLKELEDSWNAPDEPYGPTEEDLKVDAFIEKLTPQNLDDYAVPIESTRQTCTIDGEKNVQYAYTYESEDVSGSGSGIYPFDELFPEGIPGTKSIMGSSYSELADLLIEVFVLNEDGTVTFVLYQPKM